MRPAFARPYNSYQNGMDRPFCFKHFYSKGVYWICFYLIWLIVGAPQGFWGSGENGHLFSGSWGALKIIYRDLGSNLIVLGI